MECFGEIFGECSFSNCSFGDEQKENYPRNSYELIIQMTKYLNQMLEEDFGAKGATLRDRINFVQKEDFLDPSLCYKLHYIADIRDKMLKDTKYKLHRDSILSSFEELKKEMQLISTGTSCKNPQDPSAVVMVESEQKSLWEAFAY
uniref:Uncharacterized protein n=1 Tax=Fibrocapsa japonica TaxID=94617 RepID=A0A7S2V3W2_9STRA